VTADRSPADPRHPVARAVAALHRLEDALLALLLGAMILLAPLQILLRGLFDAGFGWSDPLLRVLVLWVGLLGALAASRDGRQIRIDVLARVLAGRARAAAESVTSLFTAGVCGVVAFHAGRFVISEREYGVVAFSGVPAWVLESIIPFAFGAIALRFALTCAVNLREAVRPAGPVE